MYVYTITGPLFKNHWQHSLIPIIWWRRLKPLTKTMNLVCDLDLAFEEVNMSFVVASSQAQYGYTWMCAAVKLYQDADHAK